MKSKFLSYLTAIRFYVACFFSPLVVYNFHYIIKQLVNGELPTDFVSFNFFTGAAGGAIVFVFPLILLYALHIYLFYAPVFKHGGRWYSYLCFGAIPCIFIGWLELSAELALNYISMLYVSLLLSTAFWLLASARISNITFRCTRTLVINTLFTVLIFALSFAVNVF